MALKSHPVCIFPHHRLVVVHAHMWRLRIYIEVFYTAGLLRWPPKADISSTKSIYLCCMDRSAPHHHHLLFFKKEHLNASQEKAAAVVFENISFNLPVNFPKLSTVFAKTRNWTTCNHSTSCFFQRDINKMAAFHRSFSFPSFVLKSSQALLFCQFYSICHTFSGGITNKSSQNFYLLFNLVDL